MGIFIQIVFYLLLVDSIMVNILAWAGDKWYIRHFPRISGHLPITKAWAAFYLILVLWTGLLTFYL